MGISWNLSRHCSTLYFGKAKNLPGFPSSGRKLLGTQQQNRDPLFQSKVVPDHVFLLLSSNLRQRESHWPTLIQCLFP